MEAMTTQTEPAVLFEVTDSVGWITLNRPKAYNALNRELAEQLLDAVIRCDEDGGVRAVVITGKGPSFCAGGDIKQMMTAAESDGHAGAFLKTLTVSLHETIATMAHMSKPVITAVNGAAAGAGFSSAHKTAWRRRWNRNAAPSPPAVGPPIFATGPTPFSQSGLQTFELARQHWSVRGSRSRPKILPG
jgi:hypothetical protein